MKSTKQLIVKFSGTTGRNTEFRLVTIQYTEVLSNHVSNTELFAQNYGS